MNNFVCGKEVTTFKSWIKYQVLLICLQFTILDVFAKDIDNLMRLFYWLLMLYCNLLRLKSYGEQRHQQNIYNYLPSYISCYQNVDKHNGYLGKITKHLNSLWKFPLLLTRSITIRIHAA